MKKIEIPDDLILMKDVKNLLNYSNSTSVNKLLYRHGLKTIVYNKMALYNKYEVLNLINELEERKKLRSEPIYKKKTYDVSQDIKDSSLTLKDIGIKLEITNSHAYNILKEIGCPYIDGKMRRRYYNKKWLTENLYNKLVELKKNKPKLRINLNKRKIE